MSDVHVFTMTPADCDRAAQLIRQRVLGDGHDKAIGRLASGDDLREMPDLFIELAERDGELDGYLSWSVTYSTWRGLKGIYINDQYSVSAMPAVHSALIQRTVSRGLSLGAKYIRTEFDMTEDDVMSACLEAGFTSFVRRSQYYLEASAFSAYVARKGISPLA